MLTAVDLAITHLMTCRMVELVEHNQEEGGKGIKNNQLLNHRHMRTHALSEGIFDSIVSRLSTKQAITVPRGNQQAIRTPIPGSRQDRAMSMQRSIGSSSHLDAAASIAHRQAMNGVIAVVLERPEIIKRVWGISDPAQQKQLFVGAYDPATRQQSIARILRGFRSLFCGESILQSGEWIKVLNIADQLSRDGLINGSVVDSLSKLYKFHIKGQSTPEIQQSIQRYCVSEGAVTIEGLLYGRPLKESGPSGQGLGSYDERMDIPTALDALDDGDTTGIPDRS